MFLTFKLYITELKSLLLIIYVDLTTMQKYKKYVKTYSVIKN